MKFIIVVAAILAVTAAATHTDLLGSIIATASPGADDGIVLGTVAGAVNGLVNGVSTGVKTITTGLPITVAGAVVGLVVDVAGAIGLSIVGTTYTFDSIFNGERCTIEVANCGLFITTDDVVNGNKQIILNDDGHLIGVTSRVIACINSSVTTFVKGLVITATDYPVWQQCYCIMNNCLHQLRLMCNSLEDLCKTAKFDLDNFDITAQINMLSFVNAPVDGKTTVSVKLAAAVYGYIKAHIAPLDRLTSGILAVTGKTDCSAYFVNH